jgi:hypothetical protein
MSCLLHMWKICTQYLHVLQHVVVVVVVVMRLQKVQQCDARLALARSCANRVCRCCCQLINIGSQRGKDVGPVQLGNSLLPQLHQRAKLTLHARSPPPTFTWMTADTTWAAAGDSLPRAGPARVQCRSIHCRLLMFLYTISLLQSHHQRSSRRSAQSTTISFGHRCPTTAGATAAASWVCSGLSNASTLL